MKRRTFVKASLLTGTGAGLIQPLQSPSAPSSTQPNADTDYYELRVYTLKNGRQRKVVENYWQQAAIPALNRLGSRNIGVFSDYLPEGFTKLVVLIPFPSLESYFASADQLAKDSAYQQAASEYLNAEAATPAYERIESSLLKAFSGMPKLEAPEKKPRIFELRRYESPSEAAGKKKIEMFNEAGEIAIFKRVGLTPVFFGETLIGPLRPNLTYMLTFDNMEEHDQNWKAFGSDPEWKKVSARPEYANDRILSNIHRTFLVPAAFSQI
ncbi:NIPSNAP family protein [Larkinella soli]|uniref:NIPSNAP family protein n=1 Tax=Larkinella soli TaxID=1770527 RepID=UPI000FFBB401|nr:NIPSNAP family protein [Larkinella soli]